MTLHKVPVSLDRPRDPHLPLHVEQFSVTSNYLRNISMANAATLGCVAQGSLSVVQTAVAVSLLIGCGAASAALYFYSRRYVGQLQYLPDAVEPRLCFSVLDFWGHRQVRPFVCPHEPSLASRIASVCRNHDCAQPADGRIHASTAMTA